MATTTTTTTAGALEGPSTKLQKLALVHADEGTYEDIRHSNALAMDSSTTEEGYFLSFRLVGSVMSLGLAVSVSYWAFSPAAAILTDINADIGKRRQFSLRHATDYVLQDPVTMQVFFRSSGPSLAVSAPYSSDGSLISLGEDGSSSQLLVLVSLEVS